MWVVRRSEVDPETSEVAVVSRPDIAGTWSAFFQARQRYRCGQVATHSAVVHSVTITVDGKTIPDAAHVPLNNATDGPGPDKSASQTFCAALLTSKSHVGLLELLTTALRTFWPKAVAL